MTHTLEEIARATGLELVGDGGITVNRLSEPASASADCLAIATDPKFADKLERGSARAAVLWAGADWQKWGLGAALIATKPRVALAGVTGHFSHPADIAPGIHPTAFIDPAAGIGEDVWIGAFTVIGARARIGDGARIASHVTIGADADIGSRALIHSGVRFGARCRAGDDLIVQPNAVIGADGFSFEPPDRSAVEEAKATGQIGSARATRFMRIHSIAAVEIGDDVEIGAGSTLDRGTISSTSIGNGTKIDNLVQIGHNVRIGETCLLCAQVGIAGSCRIGDRVVLGGKTGVADHITIGSDVMCAAATNVATNVPDRRIMMGTPAMKRELVIAQIAALRRLPRTMEKIADIQKKLGL